MIKLMMTQDCSNYVNCIIWFFLKNIMFVGSYGNNDLLNVKRVGQYLTPYPIPTSLDFPVSYRCIWNNKWEMCPQGTNYKAVSAIGMHTGMTSLLYNTPPIFKSMYMPYVTNPPGLLNLLPTQEKRPTNMDQTRRFSLDNYHSQLPGNINPIVITKNQTAPASTNLKRSNVQMTTNPSEYPVHFENSSVADEFMRGLDRFERDFYMTTFNKLSSIPVEWQENGMSFVQSGLFLHLTLMMLSTEVDADTRAEMEECIKFKHSDPVKIELIRQIMSLLPNSSDDLKFRESSRLMLWPGLTLSERLRAVATNALRLRIDTFNATDTPSQIANTLNQMVANDSGGAIRDTFAEEEVSEGVTAVLVTTLYLRARWRAAPTVLNGTRPFRDARRAPRRHVRMIRINDIMRYADLKEWDAEAVEISYSKPGLSFLMLVPRGRSVRSLADHVTTAISLSDITQRMKTVRVAATLPLYTLRMTLLLPNKLRDMGISRLVDTTPAARNGTLRLSHAVQRLMFWAEAGRNAFKDDGIEWDAPPEMEMVVDRPYIFFVRWRNLTLMNGHFVL